jgi:hypothetical protein
MAEQQGVAMPHFFAYMAWSAAVLLPVLGAVAWLFFGAPAIFSGGLLVPFICGGIFALRKRT